MLIFTLRTMSDLSVGGNNLHLVLHLVVFNFSLPLKKQKNKQKIKKSKIKKIVFVMHAIVMSSFIVLGLEVYVMIWITFLLL